jgi:hypothetical protein
MSSVTHSSNRFGQSYLGPSLPVGITRKRLLYSSNLAPSYVPTRLFFQEKTVDLQTIDLKSEVEKLVVQLEPDLELLKDLGEDLKNHMEGRIHLFLQQMLFLYKTAVVLDGYKQADCQVGYVSSASSGASFYVGAHSSTLATMRVAQETLSDTSVSLGFETSFYYAWNTTIYLPLLANQIDSAIDATLRKVAINLLNDVSSGKMDPQKGLQEFLSALVKKIDSLNSGESFENNQVILNKYASVAKLYSENASNGYPLIQKLCMKPITNAVDESFYMNVQEEMHEQFKKEICEPAEIPLPESSHLDIASIQKELEGMAYRLSKTCREYVKLCTASEKVRAAAIHYFQELHDLNESERKENLEKVKLIKTSATVGNIGLSAAAKALYKQAIKAISVQTAKPRNMNLILPEVLLSISRELSPSSSSAVIADQKKETEKQLRALIGKFQSPAVDRYVQLCKNVDAVKQAAKEFFDEIVPLSKKLRDRDLRNFSHVKSATRGSAGLTAKALEFYGAVLQHIQKSPQSTRSPRNMHLILYRLLLDQCDPQ